MDPDPRHPDSCQDYRRLLIDQIDDDLDTNQRAALRDHIQACGACREYEEQLDEINKALRSLPLMRLPEQAVDDILSRTVDRKAPSGAHPVLRRLTAGLAAAAVVAFAFTLTLTQRDRELDLKTRQDIEKARLVLGIASGAVARVQQEAVENAVGKEVPEVLQQLFDKEERS